MKKRYSTVVAILLFSAMGIKAQKAQIYKRAFLNEHGQIEVEEFQSSQTLNSGSRNFNLVDGFPSTFLANQYFKNFRGVVLADVDQDGQEEIIVGIDQKVYAIGGNGEVKWESPMLPGNINYPPSVADMDGDGDLEIAVHTNEVSTVYDGSVSLLDHEGNMLPGWPMAFEDNTMTCSPAIADIDGDGTMEIISLERRPMGGGVIETGVHVFNLAGEPFSENWPLTLEGTPAITPAIGDVDNDGSMDIVVATSNGNLFVLHNDGEIHENFPVANAGSSFSYQSPSLVDLNNDGFLEIVGAWHGDAPGYFIYDHTGEFYGNWPFSVSGWTYSSPTVVDSDADGNFEIYYGMPTFTSGVNSDVVFGFDHEGALLENFPISKEGGLEGVISVADVDGNGVQDLVFTSNITDAEGFGFIHAYAIDGSGEVEGFPLRPKGFTFLNAAILGDIDGDNLLDLTSLSYTQFTGGSDSTFIYTYNLGVEYNPEDILSNGYHGGNAHNGFIESSVTSGIAEISNKLEELNVYPNPSSGLVNIEIPAEFKQARVRVMDMQGRLVFEKDLSKFENSIAEINLNQLNKAAYFIILSNDKEIRMSKWIRE